MLVFAGLAVAAAALQCVAAVPVTLESASDAPQDTEIIFNNVRIYDGHSDKLSGPMRVHVKGDSISAIKSANGLEPIVESETAQVIEGNGRTLMPGLIDAHWHCISESPYLGDGDYDPGYTFALMTVGATDTLMRGFTTVRDAGGPAIGLKRAIDEGFVVGPRIYPAGALISQTGGHADARKTTEQLRRLGGAVFAVNDPLGMSLTADGVPEVLAVVREQLRKGATQIKLTVSGGVASKLDPIDSTQYTLEEMRAAVQAAEDWGTYVMTHAYHPKAVQRAIEAGVKSIEHGHMLDEETLQIMADKGIWLSTQPFMPGDYSGLQTDAQKQKYDKVAAAAHNAFILAKKLGVKMAFGTDKINRDGAANQARELLKFQRWFTNAEILRMATGNNGEIVRMSGLRNPYPKRLGVVEEGAYADLLLVDGNPLEDLEAVADQARLHLIMKDGKIYKNTVEPSSRPATDKATVTQPQAGRAHPTTEL